MFSLKIYIIFGLIFTISKVTFGQEEMQCNGQKLDVTEEQMLQMKECLDMFNITNIYKTPPAKVACLGLCILEKKKMITKDGKVDKDGFNKYIDKMIKSEKDKKALKKGIEKCVKDNGEVIKEKNDVGCYKFMNTGECIHDVFLEVCVPEKAD